MNIVSVLAAAAVSIMLGMVWYSPAVFGRRWMLLVNMGPEDAGKGMRKSMTIAIVGAVLQAGVLALLLGVTNVRILQDGLLMGFLIWLGIIVPAELSGIAWEKRPVPLIAINAGWSLASILAMSAVLVFLS